MKLSQKRVDFAQAVVALISKARELGFNPAGNDWKRDDRCPYGSSRSAHHEGLAVDILLYDKDLNWLNRTEDYLELGEWWEQEWGGRWGGRFRHKDGNHFEYTPAISEVLGEKGSGKVEEALP